MQIDFYEEFPKKENLEKLKLVKWKTRVFVAAKSLQEFQSLEREIKKIKRGTEVAYWPIVPNSYWVSPFSNTRDLIELFKELDSIKNQLLIDLELPLKKPSYFIKNILRFRKNKKLIKQFLEKNKSRVTTAEYPSTVVGKLMKAIGLNYSIDYERSIMWYTSMFPKWLIKSSKKGLQKIKDKSNYSVGLGTIDIGIMGNEPILVPKKLEEDLNFCKETAFKKIIIFRLGGLNKDYIEVLNKFVKKG